MCSSRSYSYSPHPSTERIGISWEVRDSLRPKYVSKKFVSSLIEISKQDGGVLE